MHSEKKIVGGGLIGVVVVVIHINVESGTVLEGLKVPHPTCS